jgi:peptidylprolyl isomerase
LVAALAAGAVAVTVTLTGCSTPSSSVDPTGGVTVTDLTTVLVSGAPKTKPSVSVPTPLSVTKTERTVVTSGTGAKAALGQRVTIEYVGVNGTDGKEFDTSYGQRPASFVLDPKNNLKGLVSGLIGTPAGSRIVLAIPPADAYGLQGRPKAGIGPTDTLLLVVDLLAVKAVLARATGAAVAAKAGLPAVTLDARGAPKITLPGGGPPSTLVVQPLIVGTGPRVTRGQQITVHYTGVFWPGGKQFDSSWGRSPSSFEIGTGKVISGWDRGLVGQTVGSQILLVIPPDDGYGAEGRAELGIKGTDTLTFVVDILDAA